MKVSQAIKFILDRCGRKVICFFTNGFISREAFSAKDRNENFYMLGSMGLIASVGLGVALNTSKKVFVFDGDGSILMNMGIMPLIGYEQPKNLVHFILDNGSYASTGGQPTISGSVDFSGVAKDAGYKSIFVINGIEALKRKLDRIMKAKGPAFVHLNIKPETTTNSLRVNIGPPGIVQRIIRALNNQKG